MNEFAYSANSKKKKSDGLSAKNLIIPTFVVILILHVLIIGNTVRINRAGQRVSQTTGYSFSFAQMAKDLQLSSDLLAEQARLYVSTGDAAYVGNYFHDAQQLEAQEQVLASADRTYEPADAREQLDAASQAIAQRSALECRAMRLSAEALGSDVSAFPAVAQAALEPAEEALSPEQKLQTAAELLVSPDYLQLKGQVGNSIDGAVQSVSSCTAQAIGEQQATLRRYQILQWCMMAAIMLVLAAICVTFFMLLILPLERTAKEIERGETVTPDRGLAEFRRLCFAYNELLHHRKMMETYLRQQSQTDPLTGLSNRLAFQNFISNLSWEKAHSSVIVFSLDVNGLKETNDTNGHAFGDKLLRNCAECIRVTLGNGEGKYCFRFGGDEFAAFWVDVPPDTLDDALRKFEEEQAKREVSISVGCAYAQDLSETTVDALFEEADKHMYDDKAEYHRQQAQEVLDRLKLMDY